MSDPLFFVPKGVLALADVVVLTGAVAPLSNDPGRPFYTVAALDLAGPTAIALCEDQGDAAALGMTQAGACFVTAIQAALVPSTTIALVTAAPRRAFAQIVAALYPGAGRPASMFATRGINPAAFIHFEARLEPDVTIDPGVVIGPGAEVGAGTVVGANSVIGPEVRIGRNCAIGAHVTIAHALIGNGVVIGPGVRIGQDGPIGEHQRDRLEPLAGLGRVIIQDDVAIGANATIDRGGLRDTIIGEGSRLGTLVAIARDRIVPRHCVLDRATEP